MVYKENSNVFLSSSKTLCGIGIGGHLWGTYSPIKQIYNPYICGNHQTLGNVTGLTPYLIQRGFGVGWTTPRAQLTTNYVFISSYDNQRVTRYTIADLGSIYYDAAPSYLYFFDAVSENIIYTLEEIEIDGVWYFQLCRVDYSSSTPSKEVLHQVAEDFSYNSHLWTWEEPITFEHVKYGNNDVIVCILKYNDDDNHKPTMLYTLIYDINTNTTTENMSITPDNGYLNGNIGDISPVFYKNFLVYTSSIVPDDPIDNEDVIVLITYIIDIADKTVTNINKTVVWTDTDHTTSVYIYFGTGMIDYTTGMYYYEWIISDSPRFGDWEDHFMIAGLNLESPPFTAIDVYEIGQYHWDYCMTGLLTDEKPYMIPCQYITTGGLHAPEFSESPYICNVSSFSLLKPINLYTEWYENFCTDIVDIPQHLVWNITDTNLQGIDLLGSNNREIPIAWVGNNLPVQYVGRPRVSLLILDKIAVVGITSYSHPNYQYDWYLLLPNG